VLETGTTTYNFMSISFFEHHGQILFDRVHGGVLCVRLFNGVLNICRRFVELEISIEGDKYDMKFWIMDGLGTDVVVGWQDTIGYFGDSLLEMVKHFNLKIDGCERGSVLTHVRTSYLH
jgi:hypothetical protein